MGDYADDISDRAMNAHLDEHFPPQHGGTGMGDHGLDELLGTGDWPDWLGSGSGRRINRPGLSSERRHIEREMAKLRARQAELDAAASRFGEEPPVGTVITFQKHFPNSIKTYSYAAIRTGPERVAGAGWFLTGRDASQPRTWAWLTDFIGDGPFRVIMPESISGKAAFFKAMTNRNMPSNMVLVVDETGKATVGVDPATPREPATDWDTALRAARKQAVIVDLVQTKRPGDEFPSYVAAPGRSNYNPLAPFVAHFDADMWKVLNRSTNDQVVKSYRADEDGERRARQSAVDRNRLAWKSFRGGLNVLPVGSRVRSKANPKLWAVRHNNGWARYNGDVVQGVRLTQDTMLRQLGDAIEPIPSVL